MATRPPSYYGEGPRVARLPQPEPGNAAQRIGEGLDALGRAGFRAAREREEREAAEYRADLQIKLLEDQRDLSQRTATSAAQLAMAQGNLQAAIAEARGSAGPGAEGHEQRVGELVETFRSDFMTSLGGDPRLQEQFLPDVARIAASAWAGEAQFAITRRAERAVTDGDLLRDKLANNLLTAATGGAAIAEQLTTADGLWDRYVDAAPLPADARETLRRQGRAAFRIRAMQGVIESNPAGAIEQIDAGVLNGWAEGNQIVALRNSAQAAVDRQAAQARSAQSAALAEFRESARADIEDVNRGVTVDAQSLQTRVAEARTLGDEDLARDLEDAAARAGTNDRFPMGTPIETLAAARRQIEGTANWQRNRQLVAAHTQLGRLISATGERAATDQVNLFSQTSGRPLPPFNIADPAVMRRYFEAGDAAARLYAAPPQYIPREIAENMRREWNSGTAGSKADLVQTFASYGPSRARYMMMQIAPTRPEFAVLTDLSTMRDRGAGQQTMREALEGWALPPNERVMGNAAQREAVLRGQFGEALRLLGPERQTGTMRVAEGIYRYHAAQNGIASFDGALFRTSYETALGRVGNRGGLGRAHGNPFVLPRGWTESDFWIVAAQTTGPEAQRAAGGHTPIWASTGQPLNWLQLRQLTPVLVSDDGERSLYAFRSANAYVQARRGGTFLIDMQALARTARQAGRLR